MRIWRDFTICIALVVTAGCSKAPRDADARANDQTPSASASNSGSEFVGSWFCADGGGRFLDVRENGETLLLTDNEGTYSSIVNENGILEVSVGGLVGKVSLPLDKSNNQLICHKDLCGCDRYEKQQN